MKAIAIRTLTAHLAWCATRETQAATFPLDVRPVEPGISERTIIAYTKNKRRRFRYGRAGHKCDFRFCRSSHYPGVKSPGTSCQCSSYLQRFVPSPASFLFSRALTFFFFHLHETYDANSIQLMFSAVRRLRLESFAEARNRGLGRVPRLQQDPLRGEAASNTSSNTVGALSAAYVRWASELPLQGTTAFFFLLKILFRPHEGYDAFVLFNACYLQRKS